MPPEMPIENDDDSIDSVAIIADAFRIKFGADALGAAELQRDLASDGSVVRWNEVLKKLRG